MVNIGIGLCILLQPLVQSNGVKVAQFCDLFQAQTVKLLITKHEVEYYESWTIFEFGQLEC